MAEEPVVNATSTEEPVKEPPVEEPAKEPPVEEPAKEPPVEEPVTEEVKSHLFAIRTTGGQEKVVMRILETRARMNKINIQSVLWVNDLKGYVVIEALDPSAAYQAIEGVRHIRGQLRGELEFKDIEGYLIKKSTVAQLAVDQTVEITGGPFKGMKATITRIDHEKEEATVLLLEASYELPVTVDANYLKISVSS
ncbi:MAG: Transcription elongation factor Spt5 (modular protein) [Nitrosopumilales archaeon]|nr:MAG: Transcription elongation factor Spt5 (modular protein) [Nitrosopumilales archaeon]